MAWTSVDFILNQRLNPYHQRREEIYTATKHANGMSPNSVGLKMSVDLRAARKFTGHWSLHRPHSAISSVNCVGVSWKLKSTCQDQNNVSTSFISIIYDNLYQYQPMMSPVAADIDKSDFSCHWLKVSRGLLLLFSSWKWSVQNCIKTLVNAHFYRTVIMVTFLIGTRSYINISVEMLNQMFY